MMDIYTEALISICQSSAAINNGKYQIAVLENRRHSNFTKILRQT